MKRKHSFGLSLCVFVVVVSLVSVAAAAPVPFTTASMVTGTTNQYNPQLDGKWASWTEHNILDPDVTARIGIRDRDAGTTRYLGTTGADGDQDNADVSQRYVVYESNADGDEDIWYANLGPTTLTPVNLTPSSSLDEVEPRVDANLVVWRVNDVNDTLSYKISLGSSYAYDVPGASAVLMHDVSNGRIVWIEGRSLYSFAPGVDTFRVHEYTAPVGSTVDSIKAHGSRVALTVSGTDQDAIVVDTMHKPTSAAVTNVVPSSADQSFPSVFHKDVSWQTDAGDHENLHFRMLGDSVTTVAGTTSQETRPSLWGRRAAFQKDVTLFNNDIWLGTGAHEIARTAGSNRYATAAAVSKAYFDHADNVVVCTGENFPDALSAAPLARVLGAPLLLVRRDYAPAETLAEINRLNPDYIYFIGGTSVISQACRLQVAGDFTPSERIDGANRYETSAKVALRMKTLTRPPVGIDQNRLFFARGDSFPDALAVGPIAAGARSPVLLVQPNALPAAVAAAVRELGSGSAVIVGGTDVVSQGVEDAIHAVLFKNWSDVIFIGRAAGATRYETAVEVVKMGLANGWIDLDTLGVATGLNFPDALGGGAAMAAYGSPLILTQPGSVPAAVSTFLTDHEYEVGRVDVFGGSDVVSDAVKNAIAAKLK